MPATSEYPVLDSQHLHDFLSKLALLTPHVHGLETKTQALHTDIVHAKDLVVAGRHAAEQAFEALKTRLQAWETAVQEKQKQIDGQLDPFTASLVAHREQLHAASEQLRAAIETLAQTTDTFTTNVDSRVKNLEQRRQALDQAFATLESNLEQHITALGAAAHQADTQAQAIVTGATQSEQTLSAMLDHLKTIMDHAVAHVNDGVTQHNHQLDARVAAYTHQLDQLSQTADQHTQAIEASVEQHAKQIAADILQIVADVKHGIENAIAIFHDTASTVTHLKQLADPIIETFKGLVHDVESLVGSVEHAAHAAQEHSDSN